MHKPLYSIDLITKKIKFSLFTVNGIFDPKRQILMEHLICGEHYKKFIMLIYCPHQIYILHYHELRFYLGERIK